MACELAGLPAPPRSAVQPLATLSVLPAQQTRRMAASANGLGSQNTKNRHHRVESTRDCVNEESENMDLDEPRRKRDKVGSQVIDLTLPEKPATLPCVSCGDDYDPTLLAHMACEHDYCQDCVQRVVVNALNDEACYPPRCCRQPFHIDAMRHFLTPEIISGFHEKQIEFGTTNRIYCSNPTCSTFLYPANITRDRGDCPICLVATCTICKGASHSGDCPQDTGVQQVLALANGEGWRRCSKCKAVVELGHGCNHITCRCKAEWCYVCCAAWKTCPCPTWHEDRLLARAEHIVDQQPAAAPQPPQLQRPQQVAAARQYALEHHNCDHQAWSKVGGFANCDECGRDCNKYRFQCVGCRMDACYACRMYRL
ncbi:uncharacterized protein LY89DRAFT_661654 [Mollisia scopiformis]|uniref:RBR-type E3 ubiquitin transferase n=1 Tax=Mollisia scopiformis TaxID=149040 RepID=A0A132B2P0_MOLSC|nr:uncharacterized protein LY89DRAFT_661654 [Mollisia scopiformis]KUJ06668.1 hypothetical protein LY89DRAFT_661654 [Mollisia scopiformis]